MSRVTYRIGLTIAIDTDRTEMSEDEAIDFVYRTLAADVDRWADSLPVGITVFDLV